MNFDDLDDSMFNELIEKGFVEVVSVDPDGNPKYQLTDKASDYLYKTDVLKALKLNSPEEIRKRIAKNN